VSHFYAGHEELFFRYSRERVLVEDLLSHAHQTIEAVRHLRRQRAEEDPHRGDIRHEFGDLQRRKEPTTRTMATSTR